MADRIEREIEEILAKLDQDGESVTPERKPVSILAHKTKPKPKLATPKTRRQRKPLLDRVSPTNLLLGGAAIVVGGLVLSSVWGPLIWASFAGVVMFIGAFVASFFRSPRPPAGGASAQQGYYWRDRYIQYEPADRSAWDRLRRRFRR